MPAAPLVLVIGGHDPSGGAGILQDAAALRSLGLNVATVPTALTIQDTRGVRAIQPLDTAWLRATLSAITEDMPPQAIKLGMLGSAQICRELRWFLEVQNVPVVLDPVLASSDGEPLVEALSDDPSALLALFPLVSLITPNLPEAGEILGYPVSRPDQLDEVGWALLELGPQAVLLKGGHRPDEPTDLLFSAEGMLDFPGEWVEGLEVHGTGCALASLIAGGLAQGLDTSEAVAQAKSRLVRELHRAERLGSGRRLLTWRAP